MYKTGLNTPKAMEGGIRPPVSVAYITVKDNVYMPTSEQVSIQILKYSQPANMNPSISRTTHVTPPQPSSSVKRHKTTTD